MGRDLVQQMQRLFLSGAAQNAWQPLVDVYRTRDGWLVKYDLAGVRTQDLVLSIRGHSLTLGGRRRDCSVEGACGQYLMEISYSQFERSLSLPDNLEGLRLSTEYRDGMLLVHLRREETR